MAQVDFFIDLELDLTIHDLRLKGSGVLPSILLFTFFLLSLGRTLYCLLRLGWLAGFFSG